MDKVYLKLTTIPNNPNLTSKDKEYELYKSKYENTEDLSTVKKTTSHYLNNAAKNPLFGRILQATIGFVHDNKARIQVLTGKEEEILSETLKTLNSDTFSSATIVGWNFSFLLPFITTRMAKYRIGFEHLHTGLKSLGLKPWNLKQNKDLQDYTSGIGWFKNSLEELAYVLGMNTELIDGKDVYNYYSNGKIKELIQSDIEYIFTLINIDKVYSGEFELTDLVSSVKEAGEVELKQLNTLEKILSKGEISEDLVEELKIVAGKLSDEEKPKALEIIRASYGERPKKKLQKKVVELFKTK